MKEIKLNIFEQIGSSAAVSSEDGEILYGRIVKGLAENNVKIALDFTNIELITSTFLNAAIGQLYNKYDSPFLRERLRVENMEKEDLELLKKVVERAKEYFKDKAKIFESLETNELTIDYKETISKDGREDWISYNFEFVGKDNTVFRLNFRKKDVNVAVNFNFEVKDLETDRTRIKMISRNFEYLIQRNEKILNSFFRDR